ncbi:MAG: hypothetical protein GY880_26830 [Planctomycetaceae bacterium]|nr:hypothetical protein [Planctomycetaceae bacterium]
MAKKVDEEKDTHAPVPSCAAYATCPQSRQTRQNAITAWQTDVHAMGVFLYSLLAGHPPFQGSNDIESLNLVMDGEPILIRRTNHNFLWDLETISMKCHKKY